MNPSFITVVSGLPRSGTSMMMQMLEAGGMEILSDKIRQADHDNLKGYYELEAVKKLKTDTSCLKHAEGKAVKIISELLKYLNPLYDYKIIFMCRKIEEILASQKQMLIRQGKDTEAVSDHEIGELFALHLRQAESFIKKQFYMDVIYIHYNEILENPGMPIKKINGFLGGILDEKKMAQVIDKRLYRQRGL